ncbi:MAG: hypothetical protein PUF37_01065 [Prevotellaceae bacterium]|nr:hypothetical protein [Prevotellaceae bacterium]
MKKIKDLDDEKIINILDESKSLRELLDNLIQDIEFRYISDKIRCFENDSIDYSIGFFEPSRISVLDDELFLEGVRNSEANYGLSEDCEKLLSYTEKMRGTNLFGFYVKKLCKRYFEDEIQSIINWVEDCSMELYRGYVGEKSGDYIDELRYNAFGEYLWDEENETYYIPTKIPA